MINNPDILEKFDNNYIQNSGIMPYERALALFTEMWLEGVNLGVLPPKDPWEGIEVDITIAKVLNSCLTRYSPE